MVPIGRRKNHSSLTFCFVYKLIERNKKQKNLSLTLYMYVINVVSCFEKKKNEEINKE